MVTAWMKQFACAVAVVAIAGCATTIADESNFRSDDELLKNIVADMATAMSAGDIDAMLTNYAGDYHSEQGSLEDQRAFLKSAQEQGFLDGVSTSVVNAQIDVDGTRATVGPMEVEGAFGEFSVEYDFEKRNGKWMVVTARQL